MALKPITPASIWHDFQAIRQQAPLIHNITNFVVMEQTANCLLAIGASPVMTTATEEAKDMASCVSSLVLNMGTLCPKWEQSAKHAIQAAKMNKTPIAFDPVGIGATPYRQQVASSILKDGPITAIRGNASEISALCGKESLIKGVDSGLDSATCIQEAKELSARLKSIITISGKTDIITDGNSVIFIYNGHPLMSKVTGMGCTATAIIGAFLAVSSDPLLACAHAMTIMGISGEIAAEHAKGPGSFKVAFIDALFQLTLNQIEARLRLEIA